MTYFLAPAFYPSYNFTHDFPMTFDKTKTKTMKIVIIMIIIKVNYNHNKNLPESLWSNLEQSYVLPYNLFNDQKSDMT